MDKNINFMKLAEYLYHTEKQKKSRNTARYSEHSVDTMKLPICQDTIRAENDSYKLGYFFNDMA